ncbi:bifunctional [glutamine synthetase] adenylyltransferase/[glutamine synthetase]-adenylyl-L-tyrosine phosphorylase [Pleomorphomonas sp. NRK KF1]|uniref:bifunctional [glutamine synthetase] adenylyltransferase/[glutamine synthetase]-adenylyl-L-tyrosine phosphorylase n=1 Tax=Pleomorphomonas sp. NRK KF1 TaxID=2943000 RepID=UPI0020448D9B|nr:bifunctional [glutamine synthetase] adenylyltransferase/[glutamine synthetase]-adenylyl-L-tyrosine phosphorylase [Pleomorphomonas sp. NRK KF1]MCM5555475.1 bifunctional [glutamine synthetase] adenylyltransferase/[glutamine synthetase]-adenylyl-L-tyrosine phosphorylase [Pleomorphomonas sp. NRK KF1]
MTQRTEGALKDRIAIVPPTGPDSAIAASLLDDCLAGPGGEALSSLFANMPVARDLVLAVASNSAHLRDAALRDGQRLHRILASDPAAHVDGLIASLSEPVADEASLRRRLRRVKAEAALAIALADIADLWDVMEVTGALTRLADASLSAAIRFLLLEADAAGKLSLPDRSDPEKGSGWIVLAMGKQGAFELNYSSDIDLIVFFDPAVVPAADKDDLTTLFVRLTRRLVAILQERTADGYVFRTDLRLRPDAGATPVAMSTTAALIYYESAGQNWERAAMIKARPAAGDIVAGEHFLAELKPYVWRKYLDYAAIRDIHSIKRQIHAHKGHGEIAVAGHNIKLGRGGIREIEFFVQTQQLIAGGRNVDLRGRQTLAMLDALVVQGWLGEPARDLLAEAYRFLRRVEHRVQMLNDEQTHTLPDEPEGLARVAHLMGYEDLDAFAATTREWLIVVSDQYSELFEEEADLSSQHGNMVFTGNDIDPGTLDTFTQLGFARPEDAIRIVASWHFGRYPAMRSSRARELLTEITPRLIVAFSETEAPDAALIAFDHFLARLPAGVQLFSLLSSNQSLVTLLAMVMGNSPYLADTVARRPHVVDALLEPQFFGTLPGREELTRRLDAFFGEARGYEDVLDRARIFAQEQKFLIGVRVITGTAAARQLGRSFSRLADLLLERVLSATAAELEAQHGLVPGGRVALLAMGKLGSEELTAASDLDLILLYDHDRDAVQSDGRRPISPNQYYARLTQRLVTAITAPTAEGTLYDVDFRLRPSGNAGPLATRIDAFERYQLEEAWTWEHMALTRARVVASTGGLGQEAERVIAETLCRQRDPEKVLADASDMRARLEQEKGSSDPWNLKRAPGGLVDLEFVAQTLRLVNDWREPAIRLRNTEAILLSAATHGLLSPAHRDVLLPAIRLFGDLTQAQRLTLPVKAAVVEAPRGVHDVLCRVASAPSLAQLEAELRERQAAVREAFVEIVGPVVRRAG